MQGNMGNGLGSTGVAVFWDVESCPIPKNIEPCSIRERIDAALKKCGYSEARTIYAYTKEPLEIAGINVIGFERAKDTAEKYMLVDISIWASDIHCPATCMVISEDLGFSLLVDMLKQRGHSFLLCHPNPTVSTLSGEADLFWGWTQLLLDGKPLSKHNACTSLASNNSISNLSSHPNSCDNQDIFVSILMTLIVLCYGICKWLGLISHHGILGLLFVMELWAFILNESEIINVFGRRQSVHGGAGLFKSVGGIHSRSFFIQGISIFGLTGFLPYVDKNLGPSVLPTILRLPLTMLWLLEFVKWFLRFAAPPILVIWDFENCSVPRGVSPYSIYWKIRVQLENCGYVAPVIIRGYGDTKSTASRKLRAHTKGIDVIHVNPGNDAADKRIMVDLPFLARANIFASTFMLISGDSDFVRLVRLLVESGLKFLRCNSPKQEARAFHSLGKRVHNWPDIVTQKPSQPLLMSAAYASHPSDDSISNVIACQGSTRQQTVLPDKHSDQDVGCIILMIAIVLFVGASKRLRLISYLDYADVALVLEMWILMLDCSGIINVFGRKCRSMYRVPENAVVPKRSLTEVMCVLSLMIAVSYCLEANKHLLPKIVYFLLHCLLLACIEQYFGILKFFGWRV